jgi:hypothetical protein
MRIRQNHRWGFQSPIENDKVSANPTLGLTSFLTDDDSVSAVNICGVCFIQATLQNVNVFETGGHAESETNWDRDAEGRACSGSRLIQSIAMFRAMLRCKYRFFEKRDWHFSNLV